MCMCMCVGVCMWVYGCVCVCVWMGVGGCGCGCGCICGCVSELPKIILKRGARKLKGENLKVVLDQVFKYKLGCFDDVHVLIYGDARALLQLKSRPRYSPFSYSLSMLITLYVFVIRDTF